MNMKPLLIVSLVLLNTISFAQTNVLFIGDSLTAGYGVQKEHSYPSLVEKELKETHKIDAKIINGSISGSTSASGPSRLKWYLKAKPQILVLALGANDGLRGFKVEDTKKNLEQTISIAKENNIQVILVGMQMPPNYGEQYTSSFKKMFSDLLTKHHLKSVPFLLEKVAGEKDYNQEDGIHPNEKGHVQMAKNVMPTLLSVLKEKK